MGIKSLLPNLKSITTTCAISDYSGLTAGIDAMGWLHKAIYSSSSNEIVSLAHSQRGAFDAIASLKIKKIGDGETPKYISYVIKRCLSLQNSKVTPCLVIDGASLPSKEMTDFSRREDREEYYEKAIALQKANAPKLDIKKMFARSVAITLEMRKELVDKCKDLDIAYVVAPYEADAQLAFLARTLAVDFVITEDSDSLTYGCPRVMFKFDNLGNGEEIQQCHLGTNETLPFKNWSHDMFVYMSILAGCDYCENIPNLGIMKAHKLVRVYRKPDRIIKAVYDLFHSTVPDDYEITFAKAFLTFQHQRIWNAGTERIEMLYDPNYEDWSWKKIGVSSNEMNELPVGATDFIGPALESELGRSIAIGDVHPKSHVPWKNNNSKNESKNITATAATKKKKKAKVKEPKKVPNRIINSPAPAPVSSASPAATTPHRVNLQNLFAASQNNDDDGNDDDDYVDANLAKSDEKKMEVDGIKAFLVKDANNAHRSKMFAFTSTSSSLHASTKPKPKPKKAAASNRDFSRNEAQTKLRARARSVSDPTSSSASVSDQHNHEYENANVNNGSESWIQRKRGVATAGVLGDARKDQDGRFGGIFGGGVDNYDDDNDDDDGNDEEVNSLMSEVRESERKPSRVSSGPGTKTSILHQIPIQSNQYTSKLVAREFETLNRRKRRGGMGISDLERRQQQHEKVEPNVDEYDVGESPHYVQAQVDNDLNRLRTLKPSASSKVRSASVTRGRSRSPRKRARSRGVVETMSRSRSVEHGYDYDRDHDQRQGRGCRGRSVSRNGGGRNAAGRVREGRGRSAPRNTDQYRRYADQRHSVSPSPPRNLNHRHRHPRRHDGAERYGLPSYESVPYPHRSSDRGLGMFKPIPKSAPLPFEPDPMFRFPPPTAMDDLKLREAYDSPYLEEKVRNVARKMERSRKRRRKGRREMEELIERRKRDRQRQCEEARRRDRQRQYEESRKVEREEEAVNCARWYRDRYPCVDRHGGSKVEVEYYGEWEEQGNEEYRDYERWGWGGAQAGDPFGCMPSYGEDTFDRVSSVGFGGDKSRVISSDELKGIEHEEDSNACEYERNFYHAHDENYAGENDQENNHNCCYRDEYKSGMTQNCREDYLGF